MHSTCAAAAAAQALACFQLGARSTWLTGDASRCSCLLWCMMVSGRSYARTHAADVACTACAQARGWVLIQTCREHIRWLCKQTSCMGDQTCCNGLLKQSPRTKTRLVRVHARGQQHLRQLDAGAAASSRPKERMRKPGKRASLQKTQASMSEAMLRTSRLQCSAHKRRKAT
jgi:hypothetical protein